jgi:hypothetical protein
MPSTTAVFFEVIRSVPLNFSTLILVEEEATEAFAVDFSPVPTLVSHWGSIQLLRESSAGRLKVSSLPQVFGGMPLPLPLRLLAGRRVATLPRTFGRMRLLAYRRLSIAPRVSRGLVALPVWEWVLIFGIVLIYAVLDYRIIKSRVYRFISSQSRYLPTSGSRWKSASSASAC